MAEIIKVFREKIPTLRFIGKKYLSFRDWGEWWQKGWFDRLESAMGGVQRILDVWENGGGYVGLLHRIEHSSIEWLTNDLFEYYIGMFAPEGTPVPDGFVGIDFEGKDLGTCFIYGKESEVHYCTSGCFDKLSENGMTVWRDPEDAVWSFENCLCPRYTTPDEKGNIILDYCYFIEK